MRLQRYLPARMGLHVIDKSGCHAGGAAPFGLEVEARSGGHKSSVLLGPGKVTVVENDNFQLVGVGQYVGPRGLKLLGRHADPVPAAAERVGPRGFNPSLEANRLQGLE